MAVKHLQRFPRVLYFTAGRVPTEEELRDAAAYGPGVVFRNAQFVNSDPSSSSLEECDGVAGSVPARYAEAYNDKPSSSMSRAMKDASERTSDYDLPHGHPQDPDNERARGARPPSLLETSRTASSVVMNPPRETSPWSLPHGGRIEGIAPKLVPSMDMDNDPMEQRVEGQAGLDVPNPVPFANLQQSRDADAAADPNATSPAVMADKKAAGGFKSAAKNSAKESQLIPSSEQKNADTGVRKEGEPKDGTPNTAEQK